MSQLQFQVDPSVGLEMPRTKPTLALESCADFFDRDYDVLLHDIQDKVIKFSWDISSAGGAENEKGYIRRRDIRIYAPSAWAFWQQRPMPDLTEDQVYKTILPGRDIRSTELQRILACSQQHVHGLKGEFVITREPLQADGPNSFTVFSRESIVRFLKARRIS